MVIIIVVVIRAGDLSLISLFFTVSIGLFSFLPLVLCLYLLVHSLFIDIVDFDTK